MCQRVTDDTNFFVFVVAAVADHAELEQVLRVKEHSIYKLAQLYIQFGREKELATLLQSLRPFFATLARAKTGKIGAASFYLKSVTLC